MMIQSKELLATIGLGLIGGFVGTKVMEPVAMKVYQWESAEDREQEEAVRPGPPYEVAARKTTQLLGLNLSDQQLQTTGTAHLAFGLGVAATVELLNWLGRHASMRSRRHA